MRSFIATTIVALTLGTPAAALAQTSVDGTNCVAVSESAGVDGLGVSLDAELCETHHVSTDLVAVEAGGPIEPGLDVDPHALVPSGGDPSAELTPVDDPRARIEGILEFLLEQAPSQGDIENAGGGDDGVSASDVYRQIVEGAGMRIHEDTVCDDSDWMTYTTECWWDDYLVGSYVRDALVSWVDGIVPLPEDLKSVVSSVVDQALVVTNGEAAPPELTALEVPTPESLGLPSFEQPGGGESGFEVPEFEQPGFEVPEFEQPGFEVPEFDEPALEVPAIDVPQPGLGGDPSANGNTPSQAELTAAIERALSDAQTAAHDAIAELRSTALAAPGQVQAAAAEANEALRTAVRDARLAIQDAADAAIEAARAHGDPEAEAAARSTADYADAELGTWMGFVQTEIAEFAAWIGA